MLTDSWNANKRRSPSCLPLDPSNHTNWREANSERWDLESALPNKEYYFEKLMPLDDVSSVLTNRSSALSAEKGLIFFPYISLCLSLSIYILLQPSFLFSSYSYFTLPLLLHIFCLNLTTSIVFLFFLIPTVQIFIKLLSNRHLNFPL